MVHAALIAVPYDSGHHDERMGRGPARVLERGLADRLQRSGHAVTVRSVAAGLRFPTEIACAFALARAVAAEVRDAITANRFPVVLAGNCSTALGTVAGLDAALGAGRTGVLWLDAHGDFNTPETTTSGFFDGTALAALTGRCWAGLTPSIPGFRPVPEPDVLLLGARDLDAGERALLEASSIVHVPPPEGSPGPGSGTWNGIGYHALPHLDRLAERVDRVYLHIDLDVLDPSEGRANQYAAPGGPSAGDLAELLLTAAWKLPVRALAITAYDPSFDAGDRLSDLIGTIIGQVLAAASGIRPR